MVSAKGLLSEDKEESDDEIVNNVPDFDNTFAGIGNDDSDNFVLVEDDLNNTHAKVDFFLEIFQAAPFANENLKKKYFSLI